MDADPKRRWWRKRRWRVALAFWLMVPIAYPLSLGPLSYVTARGWWHAPGDLHEPLFTLLDRWRLPEMYNGLRYYQLWGFELAIRHNVEAHRRGGGPGGASD